MKKLFLFPMLLTTLHSFPQIDCENFSAAGISYAFPKTIAGSYNYFTELGITGEIGVAYTHPKTFHKELMDSIGNMLDIFAGIGWRIWRSEYFLSIFAIAGFTMGDQYKAQPFTTIKFLFPANNKAYSIEPLYIFGRGASCKATIYFRL